MAVQEIKVFGTSAVAEFFSPVGCSLPHTNVSNVSSVSLFCLLCDKQ